MISACWRWGWFRWSRFQPDIFLRKKHSFLIAALQSLFDGGFRGNSVWIPGIPVHFWMTKWRNWGPCSRILSVAAHATGCTHLGRAILQWYTFGTARNRRCTSNGASWAISRRTCQSPATGLQWYFCSRCCTPLCTGCRRCLTWKGGAGRLAEGNNSWALPFYFVGLLVCSQWIFRIAWRPGSRFNFGPFKRSIWCKVAPCCTIEADLEREHRWQWRPYGTAGDPCELRSSSYQGSPRGRSLLAGRRTLRPGLASRYRSFYATTEAWYTSRWKVAQIYKSWGVPEWTSAYLCLCFCMSKKSRISVSRSPYQIPWFLKKSYIVRRDLRKVSQTIRTGSNVASGVIFYCG